MTDNGIEATEKGNGGLRRSGAGEGAAGDVSSFLLYYKQRSTERASREAAIWTRDLIDAALNNGARFYPPYRLHATRSQFEQALGGGVPASDQQVREAQQQGDSLGVFRQAPVAHLVVSEVTFHIEERMFHLRPYRHLAFLPRPPRGPTCRVAGANQTYRSTTGRYSATHRRWAAQAVCRRRRSRPLVTSAGWIMRFLASPQISPSRLLMVGMPLRVNDLPVVSTVPQVANSAGRALACPCAWTHTCGVDAHARCNIGPRYACAREHAHAAQILRDDHGPW